MSGKNSDAAARIKEMCPTALHIHRYVHRLNLVLVDTKKSVPEAADFFSLLERLHIFMSGSYVHNKWKIMQHEKSPGLPPIELQSLSDTRLACKYYSVHVVLKCLPVILKV